MPTINDVASCTCKRQHKHFGRAASSCYCHARCSDRAYVPFASLKWRTNNSIHKTAFASVEKERSILHKINKFKNILDQNMKGIPRDILEDLDTNCLGILSVIRNYRNERPSNR